MSAEVKPREAQAESTLADMVASEPATVTDAAPFGTDVLTSEANGAVGLWQITWKTQADDSLARRK